MAFKEALFWVGLTVFGTGLYFAFEKENVRLAYAIVLIVVGLAGMAYPVLRHHYPEKQLPAIRAWLLLLMMTWLAFGYNIYAIHTQKPKIVEKTVEKLVPQECPQTKEGQEKSKTPKVEKPKAPAPSDPKAPAPLSQNCPQGICNGGDNNGQQSVYNFSPPERHLNATQIQSLDVLAQSLPDDTDKWLSIESLNTPEATTYANEINTVFQNRGKSKGVVIWLVTPANAPKGLAIFVLQESPHFSDAEKIAKTFGSMLPAGSVIFSRATGLNSSQVKIVIGPQVN